MFSEKQYEGLKGRLKIDGMRLDDELIQQPVLLQTVIELAADALQIRDAAKHALDLAEADAAWRIRSIPDENGKLPAENKVTALIPLDREVKAATQELDECKHDLAYWQGLVDSFKEKGSSLKRIAELTIAGYLAPNAAYAERREEINRGRTKLRS